MPATSGVDPTDLIGSSAPLSSLLLPPCLRDIIRRNPLPTSSASPPPPPPPTATATAHDHLRREPARRLPRVLFLDLIYSALRSPSTPCSESSSPFASPTSNSRPLPTSNDSASSSFLISQSFSNPHLTWPRVATTATARDQGRREPAGDSDVRVVDRAYLSFIVCII
ncbi:hypothetical protein C8R44DRAFT_992657 [Mycena epipterygia]|nr:hypothetical protein C8R44DRAFT_992657 [Mycena epipterygia]